MSIALTEDQFALSSVVKEFLAKRQALSIARDTLESADENLPEFWDEMAQLGWFGLHLPECYGGSGGSFEDAAVVAEQLGRSVTPGPIVPTLIAGGVLAAADNDAAAAAFLPGLSNGSLPAGIALTGSVLVTDGVAAGTLPLVLGGGLAKLLVVPAGLDAAVISVGEGVNVTTPRNLDPTRRSSRVVINNAPATILAGGARLLLDLARMILSAEAAGIAQECSSRAAEYAKHRVQFGRPIATFQAVKHHCANMLVAAESATAAAWDASRAAAVGGDQLSFAAAIAAIMSAEAADLCVNLHVQVLGGIGVTWEHDAHLFTRRATAALAYLKAGQPAADLVDLTRRGVARSRSVDLPAEAEVIRQEVARFTKSVASLAPSEQRLRLRESGYGMPHWPKPYGRAAGPVEQLVIEEEFLRVGISRPVYGITGWVILSLIQHGTPSQVQRWVGPALAQDVIWCQLFSEPDAGSDAAGIKTRATRVDGGWLVNGQKVWTSGAHVAAMGFATVRTDLAAPKHMGVTMMAIDMHAEGVNVRPLRMMNGMSEFNEVFLSDVFVPDDNVVGEINEGWRVARATMGNESVSIGSGSGQLVMPGSTLVELFDADPARLMGGATRVGRYLATQEALSLLNLRSAHRAVALGESGPEGAITKLLLSELGHHAAAMLVELSDIDPVYAEEANASRTLFLLTHRAMAIAGGTSEIKRNQIAERILGLPRDPLLN
jgi:alkylation response protein AidB-like acyl-CoA dehydrogenase